MAPSDLSIVQIELCRKTVSPPMLLQCAFVHLPWETSELLWLCDTFKDIRCIEGHQLFYHLPSMSECFIVRFDIERFHMVPIPLRNTNTCVHWLVFDTQTSIGEIIAIVWPGFPTCQPIQIPIAIFGYLSGIISNICTCLFSDFFDQFYSFLRVIFPSILHLPVSPLHLFL